MEHYFICYLCDKRSTSELAFVNCAHLICEACLMRDLFVNHMPKIQDKLSIEVTCKCGKGKLLHELEQILKIATRVAPSRSKKPCVAHNTPVTKIGRAHV